MVGLLLEVLLVVNQEDKVVLIEQEGVEKHSRKREEYEQRSCGQCEYGEYEKLKYGPQDGTWRIGAWVQMRLVSSAAAGTGL